MNEVRVSMESKVLGNTPEKRSSELRIKFQVKENVEV